jgi:hypothetical protein
MWKTYFKFVKLKPGRVVTALFGELDFSADDIGIEIIQALYESGFTYLEITEEGKAEMFGVDKDIEKELTNSKPKNTKK